MNSMSAQQILDREFLEIRAKILEVAASFDRIDRAEGVVDQDARLQRLHAALQIVSGSESDRAEQIQKVFSLAYHDDWRSSFQIKS